MVQPVTEDQKIRWGEVIADEDDSKWYRSFIYKGVEYSLYDCVYLYRGGLETDIGKIVMICETPKEKKVRLAWFFRPSDISNYLSNYRPSWKELFLACGEGKGHFNFVPLEAILGKCKVICTSKDRRNISPTTSDIVKADYYFSLLFDVDKLRITEEIPERIGPVKAERLLNRGRDVSKPRADLPTAQGSVKREKLEIQRPANNSNTKDYPEGTSRFEQFIPGYQPLKKRKTEPTAVDSSDLHAKEERHRHDEQRWLGQMSWEEKLQYANEQRKLVTLVNLDPSYTSRDIQDIILSTFKLEVEAKIIPHRAFSNPLNGEAVVIFKSRDNASLVLSELNQKCLVDGEGRPVVAFRPKLTEPQKSTMYPGHLTLAKHERLKRLWKAKAVGTSHAVQGYTIEADMSLQWFVLQELCNSWWQALHKRQAEEMSFYMKRLKKHQFRELAAPTEPTPEAATPSEATLRCAAPEYASAGDATLRLAAPEYAKAGEASLQRAAPEYATSGGPTLRLAAPEFATAGEATLPCVTPEHATPCEATLRSAAPEHATPGEAALGRAIPDYATPGEAALGCANPDYATPGEAALGCANPDYATPGEATLLRTAHQYAIPGETTMRHTVRFPVALQHTA